MGDGTALPRTSPLSVVALQSFHGAPSRVPPGLVDTIPLGLHRLPSGFLLLELPLIEERIKGVLFDGLDLNGFWPGLPDLVCASQVGVQRCRDLAALAVKNRRRCVIQFISK
jgi:hypothetical protein